MKTKAIAFFTLIFTAFFAMGGTYQLERVEPPFWWTGMKHSEVQVMLYGENIAALTPEFQYPGVELKRIAKTSNNNYLFMYLDISRQASPGKFEISLTKGEKEKASFTYELKKRRKGSALREGFNSSDAMYLLFPDRFANGNPANDSMEGYEDKLDREDDYGRHGGDLQGIIDHLDYIEEMGFTALWLNPVLENAMPEASYHGYAITDFYKVDPRLGDNDLYLKLSKEAKKRGIKLIQDMIMNHCGSKHWWMANPPSNDWVHYQDDLKVTNHRRVVLHDPYVAQSDKELFEKGWFVSAMPDMNQSNPLMADYLIYNSVWWIEHAGLGGIRHDTHPYPGKGFMQEWTCHIMEEYPNFNIVGEEWSPDPAVLAKWQRGSHLPVDFNSCLPGLMDFPIQIALSEALTEEENWDAGWIKVYEMLANDYLYPNPMDLVIFPDNHDMDRFYRQVNQDYELWKMGMIYMATMRGIPQIQYGTELLFSNEKYHDHGQIREDFPGGWEGDEVNAFTGENLDPQKAKAQEFLQKLLNWRKTNPIIHKGKLMQFAPENGVYTYFRYTDEKAVMVIFNKNEETYAPDMSRYDERIKGFVKGVDAIFGKEYKLNKLKVPARGALILELK